MRFHIATSAAPSLLAAVDECAAAAAAASESPPAASLLFVAARARIGISNAAQAAARHHAATAAAATPTIGAVVSSLDQSARGIAVVNVYPSKAHSSVAAKAWAVDKAFSSHSPFRRNKAVGRWFEPLSLADDKNASAFDVSLFKSVSLNTPSSSASSSSALRDLNALASFDAPNASPSLILSLADRDPHSIWSCLRADPTFRNTHMMGLVTPLTPFITGKTHTLFQNGKVIDSGLVGLSLQDSSAATSTAQPKYIYSGLTPIGEYMNITSCQGNIILTLDNSLATRQILDSLAKDFDGASPASVSSVSLESSISVDKALYLEIKSNQTDRDRDEDSCVYKIVAGDLRKGNIAVETTQDLQVGMKVRFMYQKRDMKVLNHETLVREAGGRTPSICFTTTKEEEHMSFDETNHSSNEDSAGGGVVVKDSLIVGSDCGVVHSVAGGEGFVVTKVPFSSVLL